MRVLRRLGARADAAAVVLAAGFVLRFSFLGLRSLWTDEASTLMLTGVPFSHLAHYLVRDEILPPLHALLMHVWVLFFADPKTGIRAFSALCGAGALLAFRGLARRALPERARLTALFLAAASSYWIHLAQDGRAYALLMLLSVLSSRLVFDLTVRPTRRRWTVYAALAAAGLYTHYYFAVMLAAHAAWLSWSLRRSPSGLKACAAAHAAACAALLPYWKAGLGWDYTVDSESRLRRLKDAAFVFEYFHAGNGRTNPARYDFAPVLAGTEVSVARNYFGASFSDDLHPLVKLEAFGLVNADDGSTFFSPALTWNALNDLYLTAAAQRFGGARRTEYGRSPNRALLTAQYYF